MRILIIEDEVKTASYLQKGLKENGFIVDALHNGQEGLFNVLNNPYDLLILDILLPDTSGWSIVTRLRQAAIPLPILILTALDAVPDKVKGLNLGADDYLIKPFAFSELLARVNALLRRGTSSLKPEVTKFADLEINFVEHKAWRDGKRLNLTAKEFALLSFFARHPGELLSRTKIAEHVWDMNYDSDTNVIDVAVRRLRQKIDEPFDKKLIQTVHGVGYVFEAK